MNLGNFGKAIELYLKIEILLSDFDFNKINLIIVN